jgi:hypothetical protein
MWVAVCQTLLSDIKNIYLVLSKIVRYFLKKEENTKKYVQLNYDYKDNE